MRKKLGEILLGAGLVSQNDLDAALQDQDRGEPSRLGDLLVATGRLTPQQLGRALSEQYALPFILLPRVSPAIFEAVPLDFQLKYRLVPFRLDQATVSVAMADPSYSEAIAGLKTMLQRRVAVYVAAGDEIDAVHAQHRPAAHDRTGPDGLEVDELFSDLALEPASPVDLSEPAPLADIFGSLAAHPPAVGGGELFAGLALEPTPQAAGGPPDDAPEYLDALEDVVEENTFPDPEVTAPLNRAALSSALRAEADDFFGAPSEQLAQDPLLMVADTPVRPPPGAAAWMEPPPGVPGGPTAELDIALDDASVSDLPDSAVRAQPSALGPLVPAAAPLPGAAAWGGERSSLALEAEFDVSTGEGPAAGERLPPSEVVPWERQAQVELEEPLSPLPYLPPAGDDAPDWMQSVAPAQAAGRWTGALDDVPPSRLMRAVVKALVLRGALSEQDILAALDGD